MRGITATRGLYRLLDISFSEMKDVAHVEARFQQIVERAWVPGTAASMFTILYHPPQERLDGTGRLVELALTVGRTLDVEVIVRNLVLS